MEEKTLEERIAYGRDVVGRDPWAQFVGIEIEEAAEAYAKVSMVPEPRHLNAMGMVHGAALYALADQAFAVASNTLPRPNVLVESNMNYLSAGKKGLKLSAEIHARDRKRKLTVWDVEITDSEGTLVAMARGTTYSL